MLFLVTGDKGILGSRFINTLQLHNQEYTVLNTDLATEEILQQNLDQEYIIIHFAGNKNNDVDLSIRNNVIVTSQIVRLSKKEKCKGLIYVSSIAIYGPIETKITEHTIPNPTTNYAKSKYLSEMIIKEFLTDKSYIIVRPTNIFDGTSMGIVSTIYSCFEDKRVFEAWKQSLKSKRDYIALNDVIEGVYHSAKKIEPNDIMIQQEINLGSGYSYSMEEIIDIFENARKEKLRMNILDNPTFLSYDLIIDNRRARELLTHEPIKIQDIL